MLLLIFCPTQTKEPLDQSPPCCRQIQWILKRWPPAQRRAGDFSTGIFRPIVPLKFRKTIFDHFHPGRLASRRIVSFRVVWRRLSRRRHHLGPWVPGLPAGKDSPPHTLGPPAHPHPAKVFSSPPCRFGGPFAVQ
jgi:hypothetical protein